MSKISYVDIDITNPSGKITTADEPVLDLGQLGTFDDSGVYPHWLIEHNGTTYLYYTGWMRGDRVPYYAAIGLAEMDKDRESFERVSQAPILPRSNNDPYLMHSPCVHIEDGIWQLWYSSATKWEKRDGDPKPHYHIRYAESDNGLDWEVNGTTCIDFEYDDEWAIARPCVRKTDTGYKMWYCYSRRNIGYRIGYAESNDGISWDRRDEEINLEPSTDGWDSEMIGYPYVFNHKGQKYMLYNGSDFGRYGFGLAKQIE